MKRKMKEVNSIAQVDLSDLRLPMAAVHVRPLDYPDKCVARIFDVDKPIDTVIIKDSLEEIQEDFKTNTGMVFMLRGAEDVKSLVGVWV